MSLAVRMILIVLVVANIGVLLVAKRPVETYDRATIDRVAARLDLSESERAYRRIAWAPTLTAALEQGRRENKPIVVVTSNGDVCSGRL